MIRTKDDKRMYKAIIKELKIFLNKLSPLETKLLKNLLIREK